MPIPIDVQLRSKIQQLKRSKLAEGPLKRASRLTRPSACAVCGKPIHPGAMYRDAGLRNRAHESYVSV